MDELQQHLERWQAKRLIDAEQAAAILADVAARPEGSGTGGGVADAWPGQRRLGEALGYVGAVCAAAAGLLVAGQEWVRLGPAGRGTLLLVVVTVLAAGGWWANQRRAAPVRRLGAVLWFLAVAAVAGFAGVVAGQALHQSPGVAAVTSGLAATAAGVLFWHLRASGLQQVAAFASLLATVTALADVIAPAKPGWGGGAVWAVGVAWLLLGSRRLLTPPRTAEVLGALAMLLGAQTVRGGQLRSWGLALGLLSAAALVGAGAATRRPVLLGVGAVGLFVFLFDAVLTWFGRGATVPLALLAAGGALLLVAVLTGRTRSSHLVHHRSGETPG
jgi:Predicted membrane protein (DUF2157)